METSSKERRLAALRPNIDALAVLDRELKAGARWHTAAETLYWDRVRRALSDRLIEANDLRRELAAIRPCPHCPCSFPTHGAKTPRSMAAKNGL